MDLLCQDVVSLAAFNRCVLISVKNKSINKKHSAHGVPEIRFHNRFVA